jgi:predicted lipopolysaccharide heptosyltransferase III
MAYKIINRKKLFMTMMADMIGSVIWGIPKLFKPDESIISANIGKILVIRTAYIGDVVMTLPILKPLKDKFPKAKLTFLTSTAARPILENNPYIDEIVTFDAFWFYKTGKGEYSRLMKSFRQREFDLVIEARGDIRDLLFLVRPLKSKYKISSGIGGGTYFLTHVVPGDGMKHRVDYHLDMARFLGCRTEKLEWNIYLNNDEKAIVDRMLKHAGISQPFMSAHPGSRLSLKTWPPEKCADLYDRIMEEFNVPLVLFGTAEERGQVRDIMGRMKHRPMDLSGKLSLREMAGVLARSTLFICNDSAPMHIAAAMKTPTVAIFGPSKSRETGPYGGPHHRVVEKEFPCRFTCDENTCRYKVHNACMHAIAVEDVLDAVKEVMSKLKT